MATIRVRFVMMNGCHIEIEVPNSMVLGDIMDELVKINVEKPLGPYEDWALSLKEAQEILDISKSLAGNGVSNGDTIRVDRNTSAG